MFTTHRREEGGVVDARVRSNDLFVMTAGTMIALVILTKKPNRVTHQRLSYPTAADIYYGVSIAICGLRFEPNEPDSIALTAFAVASVSLPSRGILH